MAASAPIAPIGNNPVAKRIATYINRHWEGNATAAASSIGCNYYQLLQAARGTLVRGPSLSVLDALAKHSGQDIEWWLKGK